ncbi:MAG: hypothetical protein HY812_01170 [Planctomycetes bacterium]|nr:hypothetical protein [Planctomycetota bacterium]
MSARRMHWNILWVVLAVVLLSGCGKERRDLRGTWTLDLERTLAGSQIAGGGDAPAESALLLDPFALDFSEDRVRLSMGERTLEGAWSLKSADGDRWELEGAGGRLDIQWLDADTILLRMTDDPSRPLAGLTLARLSNRES